MVRTPRPLGPRPRNGTQSRAERGPGDRGRWLNGDERGRCCLVSSSSRDWGRWCTFTAGPRARHSNRHRYYDPEIGRYVSVDPMGQWAGIALYAYAMASPPNEIDPLGLWENTVDARILAGGALGLFLASMWAALPGNPAAPWGAYCPISSPSRPSLVMSSNNSNAGNRGKGGANSTGGSPNSGSGPPANTKPPTPSAGQGTEPPAPDAQPSPAPPLPAPPDPSTWVPTVQVPGSPPPGAPDPNDQRPNTTFQKIVFVASGIARVFANLFK